MKVLNLYAGIGGNRKLWEDVEVTAVEIDSQIAEIYSSYFPNDTMIVGDAHQYLLNHYKEFDFIWASPPCPTHSRLFKTNEERLYNGGRAQYPNMMLYQEIILLDNFFPGKWCIENVIPYYEPLIEPTFKLHRHFYWSNFKPDRSISVLSNRTHMSIERGSTVYGYNISEFKHNKEKQILRNMVDPELGNYILNCARNIITKSNVNQLDIFNK